MNYNIEIGLSRNLLKPKNVVAHFQMRASWPIEKRLYLKNFDAFNFSILRDFKFITNFKMNFVVSF